MSRWLPMILAFAVSIPAMMLRLGGHHLESSAYEALVYGIAILGAAFLLTWASEVAEMDIPQGLALAFLALVAVLPEYAVDLYFAWEAPHRPEYTAFATANMTGANRLLIGIAWPIIIFLNWWRTGHKELVLEKTRSIELVFLTAATLYSFVIPLKGTISLVDTVVLVTLFVGYMWRIYHSESHEPELQGPAAALGALPTPARRTMVISLFLYAGAAILSSAEPFAESLIHSGRNLGVEEFLLVQWLAPFASEAPEVVIACILTMKGAAQAGMGAMVSSKVNQWTLLIGTLALVYSISQGSPGQLVLDPRQTEEILLTAAQSAFAVAVLSNLRISIYEAAGLFGLFITQLMIPLFTSDPQHDIELRLAFSYLYIGLAVVMMIYNRKAMVRLFRVGLTGKDH